MDAYRFLPRTESIVSGGGSENYSAEEGTDNVRKTRSTFIEWFDEDIERMITDTDLIFERWIYTTPLLSKAKRWTLKPFRYYRCKDVIGAEGQIEHNVNL